MPTRVSPFAFRIVAMHGPARACFVDRSGRERLAALVAGSLLFVALAGFARGQAASLIELDSLDPATAPAIVGVSPDGSTAFGHARLTDGAGGDLGERPVRWNAVGEAMMLPIPANDALRPDGFASASSEDGSVIVGSGGANDTGPLSTAPLLWNAAGELTRLAEYEVDGQGKRRAEAEDVSGDGSVACGYARRNDPGTGVSRGQDAILWNADGTAFELSSLGQTASGSRTARAIVISADGSTIGGFSLKFASGNSLGIRPVLWATNGSVASLPGIDTLDDGIWSGRVTALSSDGAVAFGIAEKFQAGTSQGLVAMRWMNGVAQEIGPGPVFVGSPLDDQVPIRCSESGNRAVGVAVLGIDQRGFVWTEEAGTVDLGTLFPDGSGYLGSAVPNAISGDGHTIVGASVLEGVSEAFVWYRGEIKGLHETLTAAGLDPAAQGWESFREAAACSHDGSVIVGTAVREGRPVAFLARIPRNAPPTVATPAPVQAECDGAGAVVTLSATVRDVDSEDRLTVRWSVDGSLVQTDENVTPGAEATFQHRYADGEHRVDIVVEDANSATATTGTTITVEDTTAPSVFTAPDVVVPTDPEKAFATAVPLMPPTVVDLCDGDPDLVSDAPDFYPLGMTTVTWTATDDEGNVATATQRVTVEDREKPRIAGSGNVRVPVDRGKTFATVTLPQPTATDNVPEGLTISSNAKKRYSVGTSNVTWTAIDAAGNRATWTCRVTVVNAKPIADAGKNMTVTTRSETGARVTLDGRRSSDPDDQDLTFRWSGRGVRFDRPTSAKTSATFPVGTTTVTLTVTDEAGAKKTDTVRVTVRLKNAQARPSGGAANEAFSLAAIRSTDIAPAGALDEDATAAAASSFDAHRLGIALGDHVIPANDEPFDDAFVSYAALRDRQRLAGLAAARRWFAVYLRSGDEAAHAAYVESLQGVAFATDDLSHR